jgi:3-hydroxybutyryl-CoA dehydrogenase
MKSRPDEIKSIGIAGAGTMGSGIAQISALAGFEVILFDTNESQLDHAITQIGRNLGIGVQKGKITPEEREPALSRIRTTAVLDELIADCIIEAVVEKISVKHELFSRLEVINDPSCVLATNTSSIPIDQIANILKNKERFGGMHFFNPAHIMKLVEVISGTHTSESISNLLFSLAKSMGKMPVLVKDSPGFIVNRVARHYYVESLKLLEEGVSDVETIDKLMENAGFKMGPFRLMDLIGIDTNFAVTETMFNQFYQDPKFRPSRIQKQKVLAGHHGRKSGKGFYDYS